MRRNCTSWYWGVGAGVGSWRGSLKGLPPFVAQLEAHLYVMTMGVGKEVGVGKRGVNERRPFVVQLEAQLYVVVFGVGGERTSAVCGAAEGGTARRGVGSYKELGVGRGSWKGLSALGGAA